MEQIDLLMSLAPFPSTFDESLFNRESVASISIYNHFILVSWLTFLTV